MTEQELNLLELDLIYEFNIYHGAKLWGNPEKRNGEWYIIRKTAQTEQVTKIIPEQIENWIVYSEIDFELTDVIPQVQINGTHRFRTLVIIGAGASYDYSYDDAVIKPPLANGLFQNHFSGNLHEYPGVESLSSQIQHSEYIEEYFQRQWDRVVKTHNPALLARLVDTQFYLHNLFMRFSSSVDYNKNNYSSFFLELENLLHEQGNSEKAIIVSFNYDTILEKTLERTLKHRYKSLDDYVDYLNKKFVMFKPHGSWNWIKRVKKDFFDSFQVEKPNVILSFSKLIYDRQISYSNLLSGINNEMEILDDRLFPYFLPQLLLPYKSKDSIVMPDYHNHLLGHFLEQVERIIVIGWKGTEDNFKKLLEQKLGNKAIDVFYVTLNDDQVEREIKSILKNAKFTRFSTIDGVKKGTFTEFAKFFLEKSEIVLGKNKS